MEAVVEFDDGEPMRTSEVDEAVDRALELLPGLRGHRCDSGRGTRLTDELPDTELAHLLEHAALEVMALAGSPDTLQGETVWDFRDDGRGVFRVRVQFDDDIVCLGAVRVAGDIVRWVVDGSGEPPDVTRETTRLRLLRGTSPKT